MRFIVKTGLFVTGGLAVALMLGSCSSGSDSTDGGDQDAFDGTDDVGDWTPVDLDAGEDFILQVPPGTRLCSVGSGQEVFEYYHAKRRVALKEGVVRLPRDQDSFEVDWVEQLELTTDGKQAQPTGPGVFTRTIQGTASDGDYIYEFVQPYQLDGQSHELILRFVFRVMGGQAESPVMVMDAETLKRAYTTIVAGRNKNGLLCGFGLLDSSQVNLEAANGDRVELTLRTWLACLEGADGCGGGAGLGEVVQAKLVRGQEERIVTDFFNLSWSAVHHLGLQSYLAIFDQPLGSAHGVYLSWDDPDVNYLDADLNVVEQSSITSGQIP